MTCDVQLQFAEVLCAAASWDVRAGLILVVPCDVCVCEVYFKACEVQPQYRTLFWQ